MKRAILILFSLAMSAVVAKAQISIDEYREQVLSRSLDLMDSRLESDKLLSVSEKERTGFLPSLSADGSFTTDFRRSGDADLWGFRVEPRIEQTIYAGGRVRATYRQSLINYEAALQREEQMALDVRFSADDAYWMLSAMQLYKAATDEYVSLIRSLYDVVQERYREGYVAKGDLLQVEARLSDAEYSLIVSQNNYERALHRFNNLRREADTLGVVLTSSIVDPLTQPLRSSVDYIVERRPDVQEARRAILSAEYGVKITQAAYNPSVSAGVSGSCRFESSSTAPAEHRARLPDPPDRRSWRWRGFRWRCLHSSAMTASARSCSPKRSSHPPPRAKSAHRVAPGAPRSARHPFAMRQPPSGAHANGI